MLPEMFEMLTEPSRADLDPAREALGLLGAAVPLVGARQRLADRVAHGRRAIAERGARLGQRVLVAGVLGRRLRRDERSAGNHEVAAVECAWRYPLGFRPETIRAAPASLPFRISLMSATVSCSSATFVLKLSSRLCCAGSLAGCVLQRRPALADRLIDDREVLLQRRGRLRIERALLGVGDLLEAR